MLKVKGLGCKKSNVSRRKNKVVYDHAASRLVKCKAFNKGKTRSFMRKTNPLIFKVHVPIVIKTLTSFQFAVGDLPAVCGRLWDS